jgi:hypothetical protein
MNIFKVYFDDKIYAEQMYSFTCSFKIAGQFITEPDLISILQEGG